MQWLSRMAAIMLAGGMADGLVVWLAPHPLPWAAMIPALIPLMTVIFVVIPMRRAEKP